MPDKIWNSSSAGKSRGSGFSLFGSRLGSPGSPLSSSSSEGEQGEFRWKIVSTTKSFFVYATASHVRPYRE